MQADHLFEDDDEERTLSTDTYLMELDSQQLMESRESISTVAETTTTTPIAPKKPNPMILDLAHKFDKIIESNTIQPAADLERPFAKKKMKSPTHVSRIQKQISLYERDSSATAHKERPMRQRSHRSVERMETTKIALSQGGTREIIPRTTMTATTYPSKTKSCVNLKNYDAVAVSGSTSQPQFQSQSQSQTPKAGALIVKEVFIEPPKRVTKSFHGRTDLLKQSQGLNLRFQTSFVPDD